MKTLVVLILLLTFPYLAKAQSTNLQQLEQEALSATGRDFARKMIVLSDQCLKESLPDKAIESAEKAFDKAQLFKQNLLMAKALNREAKGWIAKKNWSKANKRLQRSQRILLKNEPQEKVLRFDNAYHSLVVAQKRPKLGDVTKAQNELAILKGQIKLSDKDIVELKSRGIYAVIFPKAIELEEIENEKQSLSSTVEDLKEVKAELTEERELLEENRVQLESLVQKKQNEIRVMTESQAKAELLIEKQKHLTDSLRYRNILDSMNLAFAAKDLERSELALKEQEIQTELRQSQRNFFFALMAIGFIVAIGMFLRFIGLRSHARILEEKNKIIEVEKERSEDLLLNILPVAIANELKENGVARTRHYDNVSVMFVDFKGFSKISKQMTTEDLIRELDTCFRAFDQIIQKYKLEKIKTIGDAYMCAGGLPSPDNGHPIDVVRAALEIQKFLMNLKLKRVEEGKQYFEARIGIHTGPIIAGVVGLKKFAYDIWGDTVNVAARMETGCTAGKVNVSGATYEMIKNEFDCEYRGKVPAKNMGEVDMYFVGVA